MPWRDRSIQAEVSRPRDPCARVSSAVTGVGRPAPGLTSSRVALRVMDYWEDSPCGERSSPRCRKWSACSRARSASDFQACRDSETERGEPLRRAELSDQLNRASISVCLNLAEGAARALPGERAHHSTSARGSVYECLAAVDLLALEQSPHGFSEARVLIDRLCAILTRLMRR